MAQAYFLDNFVRMLETWGFTDVLLPFILVFAILYALLQKIEIFGHDKKNIHLVISLVIGLLFVIPHVTNTYPPNADLVNIVNQFLPTVSVLVVVVVMFLLLIGIFGAQAGWTNYFGGSIVVLAIIAVIWIFGAAADWWQGWNWFTNFFGAEATAIIIILIVFALIIAFITGEENKTRKGVSGFLNDLTDFFKRHH
ncbi:MAG TPA: hypothetical protein VJB08_00935 [Candidatus Nanoarchaeia archaeon]|nr:hypothetical protein [Candidatus Nanoarchaeia archaeon]